MRNVKYRIVQIPLFDFKGMEKYLEAMASKGWRLEKTGRYLWKYRRKEAAKLHYAVTYSPDASDFNPGPTAGQQSLEELCAAAGWQKAGEWSKMQIFVSEEENPVPLETDEALRLEVIDKAIGRSFIPGAVLMIVMGMVYCVPNIIGLIWNPVRFFENGMNLVSLVLWSLILALYCYNLWIYRRWYRKSLQSAAHGGPCAEVGPYETVNTAAIALLLMIIAWLFLIILRLHDSSYAILIAAHISLYLLLLFLIEQARKFLKRMGASWGTNIGALILVSIIGSAILVAITFGLIQDMNSNRAEEIQDIPLTLEELNGVPYEDVHRDILPQGIGSFLITDKLYWDTGVRITPEGERVQESLSYEIKDVKTEWLYGKALEQFLEPKSTWKPIGAASWGADQAYCRYRNGKPSNTYLLCWPGRLVSLTLDSTPVAEQMAAIGRKLAPGV